ncbi:transporter substrate-binding domain-containing protein [Oculatella sp. LEGE 06141]|uniref:transporter substrate-binding domain-containing protein n=1 Tax=Oculatella sp. LEGE 06141 TaxID=1828648 RepID=UPI00187F7A64|nr:transporter substrate-binding domain-containing protein [Oculatella sp. LEGE 06141]MBE9181425.1 transporter substrate-binding domain-containing protein [Oculatella sp. LEGE 06141]
MSNRRTTRTPSRFSLRPSWLSSLTVIAVGLVMMVSVIACSSGSVTSQAVVGDVATSQAASGAAPQSASQAGSTLDQIISTGKVRIAVPQDSPPFGSMGTDMQPQGYDVDVAKLVAESLEVELELVPVTSTNRVPYLQTNRADMVISSLGATPERAKSIYFSIPYAPFYSGLYGAQNVAVSSYEELAGKSVGVTQGSLEDLELTKQAPEGLEVKRFEDNSTTASALLAGQVDLIATGNTIANKLMQDNPTRTIENKFVMKNSPCYVGVRRGDLDLLQWVNVFVASKRLSGELDALSQQWFGEPLELPAF